MNLPAILSFLIALMGVIRFSSYIRTHIGFRRLFWSSFTPSFELDPFLKKYSNYYSSLSEKNQALFRHRLKKFIGQKRFIPKEGITITDEMKVLIASKAIQVTFGYPFIYLSFLYKIYVYPEQYKSNTDYYYHGETGMDGYIKLSWENFMQGEYDQTDGKSLGLHEFSHALHFENHIQNNYYLFINPYYLKALRKTYLELREEILHKPTPIRKYGATNFPEFFAVCVEVFFEKPEALYEYHANLYQLMSHILNQDMLTNKEKA